MNFKITENTVGEHGESYKFSAVCDVENAICSGRGNTWEEAIGHCLVSNREVLGVTFNVYEKDGTVCRSTVYCQSRKNTAQVIVGKLSKLSDHPTVDYLQVGVVANHIVVVGRHYDEGTLGFFIPDGCIVPPKLAEEMWVKGKLYGKNKDQVKAKQMHGVYSEGLFYGSRYFEIKDGQKVYIDSPSWDITWVEGENVANEVGIIQ